MFHLVSAESQLRAMSSVTVRRCARSNFTLIYTISARPTVIESMLMALRN